jgi:hypothetical protein
MLVDDLPIQLSRLDETNLQPVMGRTETNEHGV